MNEPATASHSPVPQSGLVVIGASTGGLEVLQQILPRLPADYPLPIVIAVHTLEGTGMQLQRVCNHHCALAVSLAEDGEPLRPGHVYMAPPGRHLRIARHGVLALSDGDKYHHARPSIDILLKSAAAVYAGQLVALILSGANDDAAEGMRVVQQHGGMTFVQSPATAIAAAMPNAVLDTIQPDAVLAPTALAESLLLQTPYASR